MSKNAGNPRLVTSQQYIRLFLPLTRVPFFKGKLRVLKQLYQGICPYEDREAEQMALNSLIAAILGCIGSFFIFFLMNLVFFGVTPYVVVASVAAAYYIFNEVLLYRQNKLTNQLNTELSSFFLNVSHYYQSERSILTALEMGATSLSREIQTTARFLEEILTADNAEEQIYNYVTDADKNLYLKLFLQQCYECFEHGDAYINGVSSFCETLETFRVDMLRSKIDRQKHNARLQGLSFVLWVPALAMGVIKKFGLSLMEDMVLFYTEYGLFVELLTLASAFILYQALNRAKYRHLKTITIKEWYYKAQDALQWFEDTNQGWFVKQLKAVACNAPPSVCYTKMTLDAILGMFAGLFLVVIGAIQNHTTVHSNQLLLIPLCGLVALAFPIQVLFLKYQFKKDRENEVDSFQLLMISERHSKTITLADLLSKMERLANYYRLPIGECLNMLSYDQTKALSGLKAVAEREGDLTFSNIVDMLISIDRLRSTSYYALIVAADIPAKPR